MKRGGSSSAMWWLSAVVCALVALVSSGCSSSKKQYNPGCGKIAAPDLDTDVEHCGACDNVCAFTGAVPICVAGECGVAECLDGFHDRDGDPSNGCECRGSNEETCTVCLQYDVPENGRDDDCDGETDERGGVETSTVIRLERAHCGAEGASCLLARGAEAVECALSWCSAEDFDAGKCGHGNGRTICEPVAGRYDCGTCWDIFPEPGEPEVTFELYEQCFDALDNDGNGVADDGPYCEVLLANARTTACSGAEPSADCPANHITIPTDDPRVGGLEVAFSYDVLLDRFEVTRKQYAAHLAQRGFCDPTRWGGLVHPKCTYTASEAMLPVTEVSWCDAALYCDARGKRLPTYAEYARAMLADYAKWGDPQDAGARAEETMCETVPKPVIGVCGADEAESAESLGGEAFIGSYGRPHGYLVATAVRHLTGNVAEWMLDAYVDWCGAALEGNPDLAALQCPARGNAWQVEALVDLVIRFGHLGDWDGDRLAMGGAFDGPPDDWRTEVRGHAYPGSQLPYLGLRCARSLVAPGYEDPITTKDFQEAFAGCSERNRL